MSTSSPLDLSNDPDDPQPINTPPREFPTYPALRELIFRHTPGFDYLIALATNVAKFHSSGWRQVRNVSPFLVSGEAMLLFRKGAPIWGGNPEDCLPHVFVDRDADRKLGIHSPGQIEGPRPGEPLTEALAPATKRATLKMPTATATATATPQEDPNAQ